MSIPTFSEVERLVSQLPPPEQMRLAAGVYQRLTEKSSDYRTASGEFDIERWLADVDAFVESQTGTFDSTEDLRQLREERADRR